MGWKKKLLLDAAVAVMVWAMAALCWYSVYYFEFCWAGEWDWHELRCLFLAPVMPAIIFFCLCQHFVCRPGVATGLLMAGLGVLPVFFVAQFVGRRGRIWTALGVASVAIWWGFGTSYAVFMAAFSHWTGD